ncbi:senescence-associated protein [Senna tora]|uniref:Senescence-associated protein n=1 Tax=Senna tora TaxID=362788 RepID=A0A834WLE6_9FABA|nr:senescence-associated protein [Senna tora]
MFFNKQKKNASVHGKRRLVSINVQGSTGPIRFIVSEEALVAQVIDTALKTYARSGRLPVLGSNISDFLLYCPLVGTQALMPWDMIGSCEGRDFLLCKKPPVVVPEKVTTHIATKVISPRKGFDSMARVSNVEGCVNGTDLHHHLPAPEFMNSFKLRFPCCSISSATNTLAPRKWSMMVCLGSRQRMMSFWFLPTEVTRLVKSESSMEGRECRYRETFL